MTKKEENIIRSRSLKIATRNDNHDDFHLQKLTWLSFCLVLFFIPACLAGSESSSNAQNDTPIAEGLHLKGFEALTYKLDTGEHILVFQSGFTMTVGENEFTSDQAVVWLGDALEDSPEEADYLVRAYLWGHVHIKRDGAALPNLDEEKMAVWFQVEGEALITADKKETVDPRSMEIYASAFQAMEAAGINPTSEQARPAIELLIPGNTSDSQTNTQGQPPQSRGFLSSNIFKNSQQENYRYPINFSPISEEGLELEAKANAATIMGGFYFSQKQEVEGQTWLLEMQADNAVIFLPDEVNKPANGAISFDEIFADGFIKAIYITGNVVMTEGQRMIRADEIYYDFVQKKAIVRNAILRSYDTANQIPIYLRASELRQLAANKFSAENAVLTTSEFYLPQISLNASSIIITDNTVAQQQEAKSKNDFDVRLSDVSLKYYDTALPLYFPRLRSNMERPDVPLKDIHLGNDNTFGTYIETNWYLTRILGLQEPEGTDSTLSLDYYSERGIGGGTETEYLREDYYGKMLGYIIDDHGEDRLGRISSRKNLEPPHEVRGRYFWQHRHFLPYKWQFTTQISYLSDRNFLESFYRKEYNLGEPQETFVHMKRIEDNWGLSFLGKVRINDFENELEEMPTIGFHWTGQSFFDDKLTFYSDSQVSRLRQRYDSDTSSYGTGDFFSLLTTRNEIDMPILVEKGKIVPFIAGTAAFEDGLGFYREIDGSLGEREDHAFIGEAGIRASAQPFWKVFPDVNSELWDLNQLRHIVQPHLTAVVYTENDSVAEQRDTINVGISQRLQTKRGSGEQQRTVDWMRLDMDVTWVNNSGDDSAGADQFIWNMPFIPLINEDSFLIPQQDRRGSSIYGPRRNYVGADYIWNISDTTAFLSEMNYDLQSGVVQQFNLGFSHLRQPNLSYYVGSRYLKRLDNNFGQHGSNALTFAMTYILDPRYTLVYAGQFDLDYDVTVRNDLTLIRRYHRLFWSITYSNDESLDRSSIVFSLWPQGIPDLAFGPERYMELGGSAGF